MTPVLSRDQIRALDRHAIDRCGVPSLVLMENAGRGAAEIVLERLAETPGDVVIVCGAGNNGGDGFVVARRLSTHGCAVRVLFASHRDKLAGDAAANHDAWLGVGGEVVSIAPNDAARLAPELASAAIVVDALLGTGLDRPVAGFFKDVIDAMNDAPGRRIALDVPSGLDANTGVALGAVVRAHQTVTFAELKLGLVTPVGAEAAGSTTVVDIGIPRSIVSDVGMSARFLDPADVASWLSPRRLGAHKGAAGNVVAIAGSSGKVGAALLVGRGSLRAGAGLVTLCSFAGGADALDGRALEEMTARIDLSRLAESLDGHLSNADAVVIGPGLGLGSDARAIVDHVVFQYPGLIVADADALTHLAGRLAELRGIRGRIVLTPHPGEMARLLSTTTLDVERDRFRALSRAVEASGAVVLLKGARTLIGGPGELPVVNPSGSPALATAGSGDVLSGVTSAMLAALCDPFRAACAAAFLHGAAGDAWSEHHGGADRGLLAHEIADGLPRVIAGLTRSRSTLPV